MNNNENTPSEPGKKKQVPRRGRDLTHKEAEAAIPEYLTVMGEEDPGVGIEHWWSDEEGEESD